MEWLRNIFCKHIWKEVEETFLRKEKEQNWFAMSYDTMAIYGVRQECIKCEKKRYLQRKKYVIN